MAHFVFVFNTNMPHISVAEYKKAGAPWDGTGFSVYFLAITNDYSTPLSFGLANAAFSAAVIGKFKLMFFGGIGLMYHLV
jgi:hypothetical protein